MSHFHAVVWLDHSEAHVMHIAPDDVEKSVIHPSKPHQKLHAKAGTVGAGRKAEDHHYYHSIVEALKGAQEILVVGPAQAKLQLVKHIHSHDHDMVDKVVGVESIDHPSDGQLVAYARKYFVAKDRMLGTPDRAGPWRALLQSHKEPRRGSLSFTGCPRTACASADP